MTVHQWIALAVLMGVIAALIWGRVRADVIALAGAAVLLATRTIRPVEVQGAFASPAIIALASLFVIAFAMELSGLLGLMIRQAIRLGERLGAWGVWIVIGLSGAASAFLNNTPIVVLSAPVVRDMANAIGQHPRRFLIPLSYVTILGGCCTLIGTSTNLLVNDMARNAGEPAFSLFEVTPVALAVAAAGLAYLAVASGRLLGPAEGSEIPEVIPERVAEAAGEEIALYAKHPQLDPVRAFAALTVFMGVVIVAAAGLAPIAAAAFSGAVLLVVTGVIRIEDAYRGLRPDILLLIAGMVVVGLSLEVTGLAKLAADALVAPMRALGPWAALAVLYGSTLFLTEILSNAAVAVLITPLAVALAETLDVSARPFLVAVMMAASAAFATPFGYQTNVLVYQLGRYQYIDFVRIGVPLNLLTWAVCVTVIPRFFPF